MDFDREERIIPFGEIFYGTLAALFSVLIVTVLISILTEFGWAGTVNWPKNSLYLIIFYIGVITGSIMAGWRSGQKGWVVGLSVGLTSSIFLLILALLMHEPVHFGHFLMKTMISSLIGAFGGIMGVNFTGGRRN